MEALILTTNPHAHTTAPDAEKKKEVVCHMVLSVSVLRGAAFFLLLAASEST